MQPLIKTNDRKQALTLKEVKQVEEELKKETVIVNNGTDIKIEDNKNTHFYWFRVNKFENLPLFIGKVHEQFGRKIDIRTYYSDESTIELYFKGYSKELK